MVTGEKQVEESEKATPEASSQGEIDDLKQQLSEKEKVISGLNKVSSKKDRENEDLKSQMRTIQDRLVILEAMGEEEEESEVPKKTRVQEALKKVEQTRQQENKQKGVMSKFNEIQDLIKDAGLNPDDEEFAEVAYYANQLSYNPAAFAVAKRNANRIIKEKKAEMEKETKPQETEAELKERIRREILEEQGALTPEGATPSAAAQITWESVQNMNPKDIKKLKEEHGVGQLHELVQKGIVLAPK